MALGECDLSGLGSCEYSRAHLSVTGTSVASLSHQSTGWPFGVVTQRCRARADMGEKASCEPSLPSVPVVEATSENHVELSPCCTIPTAPLFLKPLEHRWTWDTQCPSTPGQNGNAVKTVWTPVPHVHLPSFLPLKVGPSASELITPLLFRHTSRFGVKRSKSGLGPCSEHPNPTGEEASFH